MIVGRKSAKKRTKFVDSSKFILDSSNPAQQRLSASDIISLPRQRRALLQWIAAKSKFIAFKLPETLSCAGSISRGAGGEASRCRSGGST